MKCKSSVRSKKNKILIFLIFLIVSTSFAYLNRYCSKEGGTFAHYHIDMMNYYKGDKSIEYTLYPVWGYPLVLTLFKNYNNIIYIQALFGGIFLFLLYKIIAKKLMSEKSKIILFLLLITSIPYYAVISTKWPASFQLMFLILSFILLVFSIEQKKYYLSALSGIILGIAANFRSEYVYFSIFFLIFVFLLKLIKLIHLDIKQIPYFILFMIFTWIALIPLGLERKNKIGKFNVFAGNSNYVNMFFSIGQLPNNSLGLKFDDNFIETYLKKNLRKGSYNDSQILHQQKAANEFCKDKFIECVKNNPFEFSRKLINNAKNILVGGFYVGEIEKGISEDFSVSSIFLKEYYKKLIGYANNKPNLELLYSKGFIKLEDEIQLSEINFSILIRGFAILLINLIFLLIFWLTLISIIYRIYLCIRLKYKFKTIEIICLAPIIYGSLLMILGMYQNRFTSMFYVFLVIFLGLQIDGYITQKLKT